MAKKKLLFFLDEKTLSFSNSSENYIARHFMASNLDLAISFETSYDISKAEGQNIIFYRFEPPFNEEFVKAYELFLRNNPEVIGINSPQAVRSGSKKNLLQFNDKGIIVDSVVSNNPSILSLFAQEYDKVIVKPLEGYGGQGISLVPTPGRSLTELEDIFYGQTQGGSQEVLVQRFIDEISTLGDKRVNVLFYEPISAALRLPKEGSYLCNEAYGRGFFKTSVSNRDREIIDVIRPYLKEIDAPWVGVDIIGPYLTEINLNRPGFAYADELNNNTASVDYLVKRVQELLK